VLLLSLRAFFTPLHAGTIDTSQKYYSIKTPANNKIVVLASPKLRLSYPVVWRYVSFALALQYYFAIITPMPELLPPEIELIALCSRLRTDAAARQRIEWLIARGIDWQSIIENALSHGVLPLLSFNLTQSRKTLLPQNISILLKTACDITTRRNTALWEEFTSLKKTFGQSEIRMIPLKGIILAKTLYHDIGLRPMQDIDILVQRKDFPAAERNLLRLGYIRQLSGLPENYWQSYQAHIGFLNPGKNILTELHWQFAPARPNTLDISSAWQRASVHSVNEERLESLSPEDTLLCLCLHIGKNISSLRHLKLKNLCDINELVTTHADTLDWNYLRRTLEIWRIKTLFAYVRYLTSRYRDTPWPLDKLRAFHCSAARKRWIISLAPDIKERSRFHAGLMMISLLDTFRDCFRLFRMGIAMFYAKNKRRIFHFATR
jgi:hypothetical protein